MKEISRVMDKLILKCLGDQNEQFRKGSRVLGKGSELRGTEREEVDEFGRVTKGPYTLKNGATYTG